MLFGSYKYNFNVYFDLEDFFLLDIRVKFLEFYDKYDEVFNF